MIRCLALVAAALLLGAASAARAECIDETAVWSIPYPQGNIQIISYYVWQQAPPVRPTLFRVIFRSGEVHIHQAVPTSVAQRFTGLASADAAYQQNVRTRYGQLLLSEQTSCPLVNENGVTYLLGEVP